MRWRTGWVRPACQSSAGTASLALKCPGRGAILTLLFGPEWSILTALK